MRLRMQSIAGRATGYDVSAYLVTGILVDTGFHRARDEMKRALEELNVRGAIVTHWHEDHAGNVELIASRGTPLLLRDDTAVILRQRPPVRLYRRAVWRSEERRVGKERREAWDQMDADEMQGARVTHEYVD